MEVTFTDSFSKSLKRLIWHESRLYKTYSLFRYDLPRFFGNIWRFRKGLWNHYWWDHHGVLKFMDAGLTHMADNLEKKGLEIEGPREKKVKSIRRAVELIRNYDQDLYTDMAEKELGELIHHPFEFEDVPDKPGFSRLIDKDTDEEREHNSKVYERIRDIQESEWNELWDTLKGQDYKKFDEDKDWYDQFDGTGLRGWWD
jgi:hypothetical protein